MMMRNLKKTMMTTKSNHGRREYISRIEFGERKRMETTQAWITWKITRKDQEAVLMETMMMMVAAEMKDERHLITSPMLQYRTISQANIGNNPRNNLILKTNNREMDSQECRQKVKIFQCLMATKIIQSLSHKNIPNLQSLTLVTYFLNTIRMNMMNLINSQPRLKFWRIIISKDWQRNKSINDRYPCRLRDMFLKLWVALKATCHW